MNIIINNNDYNVTVDSINKATVSFSFRKGRRFTIQTDKGQIEVSLNKLLVAFNRATNITFEELNPFQEPLKAMRSKGYEKGGALNKYNWFVRKAYHFLHDGSYPMHAFLIDKLNIRLDYLFNLNPILVMEAKANILRQSGYDVEIRITKKKRE